LRAVATDRARRWPEARPTTAGVTEAITNG
jgi:hypothetical protein